MKDLQTLAHCSCVFCLFLLLMSELRTQQRLQAEHRLPAWKRLTFGSPWEHPVIKSCSSDCNREICTVLHTCACWSALKESLALGSAPIPPSCHQPAPAYRLAGCSDIPSMRYWGAAGKTGGELDRVHSKGMPCKLEDTMISNSKTCGVDTNGSPGSIYPVATAIWESSRPSASGWDC